MAAARERGAAEGWIRIQSVEQVTKATAWEGSVWVCCRDAVGQHEAAVGAIDSFADRWAATQHKGLPFRRVLWEFGRNAGMREAAAKLIGDATADVAVLAVGRGELLDRVVGHEATNQCAATFLPAFASYLERPTKDGKETVGPSPAVGHGARNVIGDGTTQPLDLAKMVSMGKDLLGKGQPLYAQKFFAKALGVLDAIPSDDHDDNMKGSVAACLAWLVISYVVLGRPGEAAAHARRLSTDYAFFAEQPLSDAARGAALAKLAAAAPFVWDEATCSEKKLSEVLSANPQDMGARASLAVTLFLKGDVERCLTEALKLHLVASEEKLKAFGFAVFDACAAFLGEDHAVIRQLGVSFKGAK
jgi:hypothetical protein